jgi:hypothetical protein
VRAAEQQMMAPAAAASRFGCVFQQRSGDTRAGTRTACMRCSCLHPF